MLNTPLSKFQLLVIAIIEVVMAVFMWYDLFINTSHVFPLWLVIYECLFISSLSITTFIVSRNNSYKIFIPLEKISHVILLPWLLIGSISKTKRIASISMPITLLLVLLPITTFFSDQLKYFVVNKNLKTDIIPYINATSIIIVFAYFQKFLYQYLVSISPKTFTHIEIIQSVKTLTDNQFFKVSAFWILALMSILNSFEKLSGFYFFQSILPNSNILIEALVTLVVIDRATTITFNNENKKNEKF
jgi:hypothetical protein